MVKTSRATAASNLTAPRLPADRVPERSSSAQKRFDALYETHAERVYRFCLRLTAGQIADAEDLTQEVMVAAYQSLPCFAGRSAIHTWLYRIAVFRWRTLRDSRSRANADVGSGDRISEPELLRAPDVAEAEAVRLSLEAALLSLPDPLREAFLLVKSEGLTSREAARVLAIPQGTVQSRVHDAVQRLRRLLADDFPTHAERLEKTDGPAANR